MLTRLRLQNFKAFEWASIPLRPLTVLLGPNNSGKSSIISALRLLAQTAESPDREVPLLLNGAYGDFGTYRDIVYRNHRGRPFEIGLTFTSRVPGPFQDDVANREHELALDLEYKYRTKRRELILKRAQIHLDGRDLVRTDYSEDSERHILRSVGGVEFHANTAAEASRFLRMFHFVPDVYRVRVVQPESEQSQAMSKKAWVEIEKAVRQISGANWALRRLFDSIDYLGAMRVPPVRSYPFSGERRTHIGPQGEYAAAVLALDMSRGGRGKGELAEKLSKWLSRSGIASRVVVEPISDRHYEIRLHHCVTGESENIADVGFGASQVIPVLVGGYSRQAGQVFLVEEPEIHLHPRAQAELGDFFAELYSSRVQCILETHSEHLILRLQQHIAAQNIKPEDVAVYYVYAPTPEKKVVEHLELDEKGRFVGEWPEGFFPERLNEATRLAKIRHNQLSLSLEG